MTGRAVRPHGEWPSPLGPAAAAGGAVRFDGVRVDADGPVVRWAESRPDEGGRGAVVRWCGPDGPAVDVGPPTLSARSGVNEYGGGSWWADGDRVFWVDATSQHVSVVAADGAVRALTPPAAGRSVRHAAGVVHPGGRWTVVELELHGEPGAAEPVNELAVVDGAAASPTAARGVVAGADFLAAPALSPDGTLLAWLQWDHPDMPWDAAELWVGRFGPPGGRDGSGGGAPDVPPVVTDARRVAGGRADARAVGRPVAVCLPVWSPDGELWWCDDSADWWHLHRAGAPGLPAEGAGDRTAPVFDRPEEVGEPRWVSGGSRAAFLDDGRVVFAAGSGGVDAVWIGDPVDGSVRPLPGPAFTHVEHVAADGALVALVAGAPTSPTSVWLVDTTRGTARDLRGARPALGSDDVSVPEPITFPTAGGEVAHGLFHPPASASWAGPADEAPPLVVRIHGGPTASARAELSPSVQFWTSRGLAVVEVNYRGSTGFGRAYRDRLRGQWGVVDVEDCIAAARWLAAEGRVDGRRCVIRGGSAGGFTALAALTRHDDGPDPFAAACSLYGVTDLRSLAEDTHKFESRYLDGLVGPLPAAAEVYRERSPLAHAGRIRTPVLLLQGAEDAVVPLSQAREMADALERSGVEHELVVFPGEAHGFRRASTIVAALLAELDFYGRVLGFTPAGSPRAS